MQGLFKNCDYWPDKKNAVLKRTHTVVVVVVVMILFYTFSSIDK
jgi:preprotein translocase subunit SecE